MNLMEEQKFGFGCMRLPVTDKSDPTSFDYAKIEELFDEFCSTTSLRRLFKLSFSCSKFIPPE